MIETIKMKIWGRDFAIPLDYKCYGGSPVTSKQIEAFNKFYLHPEWIDYAKPKVEKYCMKKVLEDETNQKKDNIFSYVKPHYLFITRGEEPKVALLCKYRYDLEHGLAVIFSVDGSIDVGMPDDFL